LTSKAKKIVNYEYPCGFHIFKNKKDAEKCVIYLLGNTYGYIIKKVQFTEVLVTGYEVWDDMRYIPIIVANKMKIIDNG